MKYVAKFVNGYWCSFDTEAYENTQVFYLRKDAMEAVKKMNQRGGKQCLECSVIWQRLL